MNIAVPKEQSPSEFRAGLSPSGVRLLVESGHRCYVERGAGEGAGFTDEEYQASGASIVYSGEEAYRRAELILKVERPASEEIVWMSSGQTLLGYLHLAAADPNLVLKLIERGVTAVAYEDIELPDGTLPVQRPLSQIGGRMTPPLAARLLQNDSGSHGVLLGGVPGVPPAEIVILGGGVVGENAASAFLGLGAHVTILDLNLDRLGWLDRTFGGRVITMLSNPYNVGRACAYADVLVGAVRQPGWRSPVAVTRRQMGSMRHGAIFLDLSIDEGGCAETSRPTTHQDPTYVEEGVLHCCIPNLPGVAARTAMHAFRDAAWPYLERIAREGVEAALDDDPALAGAAVLRRGKPRRGLDPGARSPSAPEQRLQ